MLKEGERPFPAAARWLAVGLNVLLLLVEVFFLIPRWVGQDEIAMVSLTVGTAFVNLTMFVDYYRRGMVGKNRQVRAGDLQPLPTLIRWGVIALNLFALCSQLVLLLSRGGVNLGSPQEVLVTSLLVGTSVVSLAILLDYNRRRV
ncbi:MAG TPA: hypothetical protein VN654_15105 [Vicinamibacterales bacterium]|nr:hypothetical protein [Vicinamibacterales bacterium]